MGFRNPITTVAAVDTGQPAGAGVKVYEGSDATGVYGVVEFRDGVPGDSPARVAGKANLTPQGGGGYTEQGGGLTVAGGSYNGTTGPELDLNVEGAPAGGYRAVARLSGAAVTVVDNLAMGPWARGSYANAANGSANLNSGNATTALTANVSASKSDTGWTGYTVPVDGSIGWQHTQPGRYLVSFFLPLNNNGTGARWEELQLYTKDIGGWQVLADDFPAGAGFSGLGGCYVYDAPAGPAFAFRFAGNAAGTPQIRSGAWWAIHQLGSLATL